MKLTALELISSFLNGAGVNNPHDRANHILIVLHQAGYTVKRRNERNTLTKVDDMLASAGYPISSPIRKLINDELYGDEFKALAPPPEGYWRKFFPITKHLS